MRRLAILQAPGQGWPSLILLLALLGLLGISIADSRPLSIDDSASVADALPVLMVAGGLIGYLLARGVQGVVRAHIIGAALGAFLLLLVAGSAILGQAPLPTELAGFGSRIEAVWVRLDADIVAFIAEEVSTPVVATFLVLGAICWTTAQFSAFSVFRYDRGGPAVIAIGTVLFLNVGLDKLDGGTEPLPVLPVLAAFTALAMLLLIRLQLVQQRVAWARRHISDAADVSRLFLRTGAAFVIVAVVGATSLATLATAEPIELDLGELEAPLEDIGDEVTRWLEFIGVPSTTDGLRPRPRETRIESRWSPGSGTAFTARILGQPGGNYWWGYADDNYDPEGTWSTTNRDEPRAAPAGRYVGPVSGAGAGGDVEVFVTLTIGDAQRPTARAHLFRLPEAEVLDRDVRVTSVDDERGVNDITYDPPLAEGDQVEVDSVVWDYRREQASLTAAMLREAGTDYPAWVRETYLQGQDDPDVVGEPGSRVRRLAERISRERRTPYDRAIELQGLLRAGEYVTDLGDRCGDLSVPECTLARMEGFCQQYATTMAIVLRQMGIPSRFVYGYLPGSYQSADGLWRVEQAAFHNWVEAYFPDIGWVRFDPTPGNDFERAPTDLPEGETSNGEDEPNVPDETVPPEPLDEPTPEPSLAPVLAEQPPTGGGVRGLVTTVLSGAALVLLALTAASLLLLYRLRRLPDGDDGLAYRGVVSLASRLGHAPHPAQTEYEFAGTLSEAFPGMREDLHVVVAARVESAYGARRLDRDRRGTLRSAYARIRTRLLRLWLRLRS